MSGSPSVGAADPSFGDIEDDTVSEALSHFNLSELDTIRRASKSLEKVCNSRKEFIHSKLVKGASVEIVGLASERGEQINKRLAVITGPINNGRYPVKIQHLTGEIEKVSLKAQNINPFLKPEQEAKEKSRLAFINYSSDAKIREGHGRLLDQVLMQLRYSVNVMNGCSFYKGDFDSFIRLPRSHQSVMMCNTQLFSLYTVKPSTAGYKISPDLSILDTAVESLVDFEDNAIQYFGKMAAYEKDAMDGSGKLIIRNFVRAMQSWDTERIFGEFWIARICKSGTVVVQKKGDDFDSGEELGDVLLVKGIGSQVGEGIPSSQLPLLARTTFLPLYNMLVYDGLMIMNNRFPMTAVLKEKIKAHVEKAVREETLIYCGESARKGLWDKEPPLVGGSKKVEDDDDKEEGEDVAYEPTPSQLSMAEKIVRFAKSHGYEGRSNLPAFTCAATLVARKVGFSQADNPNKIVGLNWVYEDSHRGYDMDMFLFRDWPGYTLDELLPELVKKLNSFINELIDLDKIDTIGVDRFPLIIKLLLSCCSVSSVTSSVVANVSVSIESTGNIRFVVLSASFNIVKNFIPCDVVAMINRDVAAKPFVVWTTEIKIMYRDSKIISPIIDA